MSITDELRKVAAKTECANGRCEKLYRGDLEHIADRIDAEHESACAEAYGNGVMSVPIALDENAWVELPKDADGEYINEHDKVDWRDHAGTWHENATVVAVCDDGCYVMDGIVFHVHKSDIRHHHAPTVEDVLREFADEVYADADNEIRDRDFLCAKYAKRLTLVDGEDA